MKNEINPTRIGMGLWVGREHLPSNWEALGFIPCTTGKNKIKQRGNPQEIWAVRC